MEISRDIYPGTRADKIRSIICRLDSESAKIVTRYTTRLEKFLEMKEGLKKDKYKMEKLNPIYENIGDNKNLGDALIAITQVFYPEVNLRQEEE